MKWETVKQKVARDLYTGIMTRPDSGEIIFATVFDAMEKRRPPRESIKALADAVYDRVMAWDVRCCAKLRELFPNAFPPSLQKGNLSAEYDEGGDWVVFKS